MTGRLMLDFLSVEFALGLGVFCLFRFSAVTYHSTSGLYLYSLIYRLPVPMTARSEA